jgi:hypothetical protein
MELKFSLHEYRNNPTPYKLKDLLHFLQLPCFYSWTLYSFLWSKRSTDFKEASPCSVRNHLKWQFMNFLYNFLFVVYFYSNKIWCIEKLVLQ